MIEPHSTSIDDFLDCLLIFRIKVEETTIKTAIKAIIKPTIKPTINPTKSKKLQVDLVKGSTIAPNMKVKYIL